MAASSDITAASNEVDKESENRTGVGPVEAFVKGMTSQVNANDVARMVDLQQHM